MFVYKVELIDRLNECVYVLMGGHIYKYLQMLVQGLPSVGRYMRVEGPILVLLHHFLWIVSKTLPHYESYVCE